MTGLLHDGSVVCGRADKGGKESLLGHIIGGSVLRVPLSGDHPPRRCVLESFDGAVVVTGGDDER